MHSIFILIGALFFFYGLYAAVTDNFVYGGILMGLGISFFFGGLIIYNSKSGEGALIKDDI